MSKTKLHRIGNAAGVILSSEVLSAAGMSVGGAVTVRAAHGRIEITRAENKLDETIEIGQRFIMRYPRAMAALAK